MTKTFPIDISQMDLDLTLDNGYTVTVPNNTSSITSGTSYNLSTSGSITSGGYSPTNATNTVLASDFTFTSEKIKILDDLADWQEEVNKRLAILQPNAKLEAEWSELKELREQYVELEKALTEKTKMWDILKDTQKGSF